MADEPNTNPESGEGEKPDRKGPARSDRATPKMTGSRSSSASKPWEPPSATPLEETYSEFSASLQQLQANGAKEYQHLLDKVAADVEKLTNDVTSSDPTKSFVRNLTEAIGKRDLPAVAEAYAALLRHTMQRQAATEKRLLDIITCYYRGLSDISEHAQKSFLSGARDYSDSIAEAIAGSKLSELKPRDRTVAAHALLLGAIVQASSQRFV
jgi:hypothetical protein